jgi:hypothetical protein
MLMGILYKIRLLNIASKLLNSAVTTRYVFQYMYFLYYT